MSSRAESVAFAVLLGLVVAVVGFDAWVDADWSGIRDTIAQLMTGAVGYMLGMGHRSRSRETSNP